MIDPLAIGRWVARRICPTGLWHDDVASAAALAAWQHPDEPRAAWRAGIDELRRLTHWNRTAGEAPEHVEWTDTVAPSCEDCYELDDLLAGLDPEQRWMVERVAAGWQRRDVAHALGITPSAVSQRMRTIARNIVT